MSSLATIKIDNQLIAINVADSIKTVKVANCKTIDNQLVNAKNYTVSRNKRFAELAKKSFFNAYNTLANIRDNEFLLIDLSDENE